MKPFMDRDFLLESETARHLYHDYAAAMPLIDYHCHLSPREIYEDGRFDDLAQIWLGGRTDGGSCFGDHYKWRIMRSNGVPEAYITGGKDGYARFEKFAGALELAIGNPMYHWCCLELHQYFGIDGYLTSRNCKNIWEHCNQMLRNDPQMTVRGLIRQSHVAFIGTTDDPIDSLEWHKKLAADSSFKCQVCPSFRPDKALGIANPGFAGYMAALAQATGRERLETLDDVRAALLERLEFFAAAGCRAADHGLDAVPFRPVSDEAANAAYQKALRGGALSSEEAEGYQTAVLLFLGRAYHRLDIVMQLHYSCLRNVNRKMYAALGPDTGFDMIAPNECIGSIAALLSALNDTDECPKTILYSLNPSDNAQIGTLLGCFQSGGIPGKIQHGAAWWFNDTKTGMEAQMRSLANLGLLGNFVGMLTDSRSFLSYTRHDYFRRILCNLIGSWVENGEYPNDEQALSRIVKGICYHNAERYFNI